MSEDKGEGSWGEKASANKDTQPLYEYSPELIDRLKRLEKAVGESPHFEVGILENLKEALAPNPQGPERAVSEIAHFAVETMRHVSATNDRNAYNAIVDVLEVLSREEPCIVPATERKRSR